VIAALVDVRVNVLYRLHWCAHPDADMGVVSKGQVRVIGNDPVDEADSLLVVAGQRYVNVSLIVAAAVLR
jgi:hypothetical protein